MEWFRRLGIVLLVLMMVSCISTRPAIILYPLPELEMSEEEEIDDYMEKTLIFSKELRALYDELVNQIKIKLGRNGAVDLRE